MVKDISTSNYLEFFQQVNQLVTILQHPSELNFSQRRVYGVNECIYLLNEAAVARDILMKRVNTTQRYVFIINNK